MVLPLWLIPLLAGGVGAVLLGKKGKISLEFNYSNISNFSEEDLEKAIYKSLEEYNKLLNAYKKAWSKYSILSDDKFQKLLEVLKGLPVYFLSELIKKDKLHLKEDKIVNIEKDLEKVIIKSYSERVIREYIMQSLRQRNVNFLHLIYPKLDDNLKRKVKDTFVNSIRDFFNNIDLQQFNIQQNQLTNLLQSFGDNFLNNFDYTNQNQNSFDQRYVNELNQILQNFRLKRNLRETIEHNIKELVIQYFIQIDTNYEYINPVTGKIKKIDEFISKYFVFSPEFLENNFKNQVKSIYYDTNYSISLLRVILALVLLYSSNAQQRGLEPKIYEDFLKEFYSYYTKYIPKVIEEVFKAYFLEFSFFESFSKKELGYLEVNLGAIVAKKVLKEGLIGVAGGITRGVRQAVRGIITGIRVSGIRDIKSIIKNYLNLYEKLKNKITREFSNKKLNEIFTLLRSDPFLLEDLKEYLFLLAFIKNNYEINRDKLKDYLDKLSKDDNLLNQLQNEEKLRLKNNDFKTLVRILKDDIIRNYNKYMEDLGVQLIQLSKDLKKKFKENRVNLEKVLEKIEKISSYKYIVKTFYSKYIKKDLESSIKGLVNSTIKNDNYRSLLYSARLLAIWIALIHLITIAGLVDFTYKKITDRIRRLILQ